MKFLPLLLFSLVFLTGCNRRGCEFECQNGGSCVDETCECTADYEGIDCSKEQRGKFIGAYSVTGTAMCAVSGGPPGIITVSVEASPVSVAHIDLTLLGVELVAVVNGSTFQIVESELDGFIYTGNGSISQDTIYFTIIETDLDIPESCTYTLKGPKQP